MAWSSLIDILTRGRRVGYLVRETHSLAFFSNNTLCLRRSMVEQIGLYDPDLQASEDVDICARIARDRWFIYKCPDMVLFHRPRANLVSLLRQWWGYGLNIPKVYRKYSPGHLELYVYWPPNRFLQLLQRDELPFTCCLFVHPFLVMHLLGLAANLIDRLYDPGRFLGEVARRINPGGLLVIASPYTWLAEHTPRDAWLGGFKGNDGPVTTLDGLKAHLRRHFHLLDAPKDMPFVIRETRRKFQHSVSEVTVWERTP